MNRSSFLKRIVAMVLVTIGWKKVDKKVLEEEEFKYYIHQGNVERYEPPFPGKVWYIDERNGINTNNGLSFDKALKSLPEAYSRCARSGDVIFMSRTK